MRVCVVNINCLHFKMYALTHAYHHHSTSFTMDSIKRMRKYMRRKALFILLNRLTEDHDTFVFRHKSKNETYYADVCFAYRLSEKLKVKKKMDEK